MPYRSVYEEPELFLEYKGVKVYHTYDGNEIEQPSTNFFTTSEEETDTDYNPFLFDVRELPDFDKNDHPPFLTGKDNTLENQAAWEDWHASGQQAKQFKRAIELAIDKNLLPLPSREKGQDRESYTDNQDRENYTE